MIDKRGVVGSTIVSFGAIIAVFIIMMIFVLVSFFASSMLGIESPEPYSCVNNDGNVLSRVIEIDGVERNVFEALISNKFDDEFKDALEKNIEMTDVKIDDGKQLCLFIFEGSVNEIKKEIKGGEYKIPSDGNNLHLIEGNGEMIKWAGLQPVAEYFYEGKICEIKINDERTISYYYGECLE